MPNLYIVGGANGSGKTTVALSFLPNLMDCFEYVNADIIAAQISPLHPESAAILAGRLMLERLQALSKSNSDFAFETTLASRSFVSFVRNCKTTYTVNLIYFWLQTVDLAVERVARRVASGGHSVPEEVIRRRYNRGCKNLISLYLPLCDGWMIYDNSEIEPQLVAEQIINQQPIIYKAEIWEQILEVAHE